MLKVTVELEEHICAKLLHTHFKSLEISRTQTLFLLFNQEEKIVIDFRLCAHHFCSTVRGFSVDDNDLAVPAFNRRKGLGKQVIDKVANCLCLVIRGDDYNGNRF